MLRPDESVAWGDTAERDIEAFFAQRGTISLFTDKGDEVRLVRASDFSNNFLETYLEDQPGDSTKADNRFELDFLGERDIEYLLRKAPNPADSPNKPYTDDCVQSTKELLESVAIAAYRINTAIRTNQPKAAILRETLQAVEALLTVANR